MEYQDYTVPVSWEVKTISTNMNEKVSLHIVQRSLIEAMNKYCEEKFDLSYPRTRDEASYYVKEHIDEYLNKSLYDN